MANPCDAIRIGRIREVDVADWVSVCVEFACLIRASIDHIEA